MRAFYFGIILLLCGAPLWAAERFDVRVLYCGNPGSDRSADFHSFLAEHFKQVTVADLRTFKQEQARDHDLIIFDWTSTYDSHGSPDRNKRHDVPKLDENFTRPTILIAEAGGKTAKPLQLKTDWLCLCLEGPAYNLALDHPVFHSPLEVNPRFEEIPTRETYP